MNRNIAVAAALGATVIASLWAGTAQALQQPASEERQVRVACDLRADGRLADCRVLSRFGVDAGYDAVALEAAQIARVWPVRADLVPGPVHFPILFNVHQEGDRISAFRLRLRPLEVVGAPPVDHRTDRTALFPAVTEGFEGRAWRGLECDILENRDLKLCLADERDTLPDLLMGELVWFEQTRTLTGQIVDLPEAIPATPEVIRTTWRPIRSDARTRYLKEISGGDGHHLVWVAIPSPSGKRILRFHLQEYDCPGERARNVLSFNVRRSEIDSHLLWPSDWESYADYQEVGEGEREGYLEPLTLGPYSLLCGRPPRVTLP